MTDRVRTIIPCAGYGTRLGMRNSESKEMLSYEGKRLIDQAVSIAENPLVITRLEKQDLIKHCQSIGVPLLIVRPKGEWPDTIIQSQTEWADHNIILLPDTVFERPKEVITRVAMHLMSGSKIVLATHAVRDPINWGVIKDFTLREKPQGLEGEYKAWGVIGFQKGAGFSLFSKQATRVSAQLPDDVSFIGLKGFRDVTRSWADLNLQRL